MLQQGFNWLKSVFNHWFQRIGIGWALSSGWHSFRDNETSLRASALTYYTALAVVPILVILFAVSQGFGIMEDFDAMASEHFVEHEQVYQFAKESAQKLLINLQGGLITSVAVLFLLWTITSILSQVEAEFNRIWHCKKFRGLLRRMTNYITMIILLPLLMVAASGATMWILRETVPEARNFVVWLLPTMTTWLLFFSMYLFLPNKNVPPSAALVGALLAAPTYQIVQFIFIRFQIGVSTYSALYGSFAAIPLFLVWVRVSWMIVLAGAELGYAWQHRKERYKLMESLPISLWDRIRWAVIIASMSVERFTKGEECPTKADFVRTTKLPEAIVEDILDDLVQTKILWRASSDSLSVYAPARPVDELKVSDVIAATLNIREGEQTEDTISDTLATMWNAITKTPPNKSLSNLTPDCDLISSLR